MKGSAVLLFLSLISILALADARKLRPFITDGCSLPMANLKKEWRECCVAHDFGYWIGGTQERKREVDDELENCFVGSGLTQGLAGELRKIKMLENKSQ